MDNKNSKSGLYCTDPDIVGGDSDTIFVDTIDDIINEIDLSNLNITSSSMNSTLGSGQYTITTGGTSLNYGTYQYTNTTAPWVTVSPTTMPATLDVKGDANFEGDIKIKGKSLEKLLESIEKRLSILVPDPEKLEHYAALQKAYEHYKTLEALCEKPTKKEE